TWAVVRGAGARVEDAGAGQPAALSRDRSRDVDLLIGPVAGADGHAPLGHDRHTGVALDHRLPRLGHRAVAGHRHVADMVLVHRMVRRPADRHLVVLVHRPVHHVAALAHLLLVAGPVGAVIHWHLVFLPARLVDHIAALAHMLLIAGLVGAVVMRHLILLIHRPVHHIA